MPEFIPALESFSEILINFPNLFKALALILLFVQEIKIDHSSIFFPSDKIGKLSHFFKLLGAPIT